MLQASGEGRGRPPGVVSVLRRTARWEVEPVGQHPDGTVEVGSLLALVGVRRGFTPPRQLRVVGPGGEVHLVQRRLGADKEPPQALDGLAQLLVNVPFGQPAEQPLTFEVVVDRRQKMNLLGFARRARTAILKPC